MKLKNALSIAAIFAIFLLPIQGQETATSDPASKPAKEETSKERKEPRDDFDMTKGWKPRVFQPSARIYFDTGSDDPNEIDLYNDGNLVPTINLLELYRPCKPQDFFLDTDKNLYFGPAFGVGISAPAEDGDKKTGGPAPEEASDAPVLLLTAGVLVELEITKNAFAGLEFGYAMGFSADEGLSDADDGAFYVGLALKFDF